MMIDLQAIFGDGPAVSDEISVVMAPAADLGPSGFDPAKWTRQPDASGQLGWQRVDLDGAACLDFDRLPNPAPCPRCGSLELWEPMATTLHGVKSARWRCLGCDPPTTARGLAARAAELRQRTTIGTSR